MATRYFHWDVVDDCVLHETDGGATTVEYTHEPSQYGPLLSETRSGVESYHHYDALGSTTALGDTDGNVTDMFQYDAWGNEAARTGSTPTPYTWVGRWGYEHEIPTGVYYIRARSYQPTVARWMSIDPAWQRLPREQSMFYCYAINSPLDFIDSTGEDLQVPLPWTFPPTHLPPGWPTPRWPDIPLPTLPNPHRAFCNATARFIASFLDTPEERAAFYRFTGGGGGTYTLTAAEMEAAIGASPVFKGLVEGVGIICTNPIGLPITHSIKHDMAANPPFVASLGGVELTFKWKCKCPCADWSATIHDLYDFDIRGIPGFSDRSTSAEFKTILVRLAQIISMCGWKNYYQDGSLSGTICPKT